MKIDPNGCCVVHEGINLPSLCDSVTYAIDSDTADYKASHIKYIDGVMQFIVNSKSINHTKFTLQIPGLHNVLNALACIALLDKIGLTVQEIQGGLNSFKGVRRRFDIQFKSEKLIYIDDYAHHPEELRFLIDSLEMMYPEQAVTAIFQPHLFTRTRDFGTDFSAQLSRFDELILLPIYPAREEEILGISSEWLLSMVRLKKKQVLNSSRVLELMQKKNNGIVVTIGAGDIDRIVAPLKDILIQNVDAVS
jgi:UDP-N-acetylmuramate--alanine ligase